MPVPSSYETHYCGQRIARLFPKSCRQPMPRPATTAMSPEHELTKTTDTRGDDLFFALKVRAVRQRSYSLRSLYDHFSGFRWYSSIPRTN